MTYVTHFHLYQIAVLLIAVFMLGQGIINFAKGTKGQTFLKLFVRVIVWGGMIVIAIDPNITIKAANVLGIIDNMNAVVLTGFVLIFLMIFKLLSAIEKLEQQISVLTRNDALKDINEKNNQ